MKKIIGILIIIALLATSFSVAVFADKDENSDSNERNSSFKINEPVIKYGKFKLPLGLVEKGMGADIAYKNGVISISKGNIIIEIDLYNKKVYVTTNSIRVEDTNSSIFTSHNKKKMTVLINYIAAKLGIRTHINGDDVVITEPSITAPASVVLTPMGGTVVINTLNSTNLFLQAQASITAGQATGGKAELYIGSKLVATDTSIISTDTIITFNSSDGTPTAAELQVLIPTGGKVTIKLYNSAGGFVTSKDGNPTLKVDYSAPLMSSISAAIYYPALKKINLFISGTIQKNDVLDVTKVQITDANPVISRILTNVATTDSKGVAVNGSVITIKLGTADTVALATVGGDDASLTLLTGNIITDAAGNPPASLSVAQTVKLTTVLP